MGPKVKDRRSCGGQEGPSRCLSALAAHPTCSLVPALTPPAEVWPPPSQLPARVVGLGGGSFATPSGNGKAAHIPLFPVGPDNGPPGRAGTPAD